MPKKITNWLRPQNMKLSGAVDDNWLEWFNDQPKHFRAEIEKKEKICWLYTDGRLARVKFEAAKGVALARLRIVVLELDGQPILPEEQEQKAEELELNYFDERSQRSLLAAVLNNFGVPIGQNIGVVSEDEDFARSYGRALRLQSAIHQKVSLRKEA